MKIPTPSRLGALVAALLTFSPLAAKIAGRKYTFEKNDATLESGALEIAADGAVTLKARLFGQDESVTAGHGQWLKGTFPLTPGSTQPVAACGAWTADDTYTVQLCQYRTPFIATYRLRFTGGRTHRRARDERRLRQHQARPDYGQGALIGRAGYP